MDNAKYQMNRKNAKKKCICKVFLKGQTRQTSFLAYVPRDYILDTVFCGGLEKQFHIAITIFTVQYCQVSYDYTC